MKNIYLSMSAAAIAIFFGMPAAFGSDDNDKRINLLCNVSHGFHVYISIEKLGTEVDVSQIRYAHVGYWYGSIAQLSCNYAGDCVGYVIGTTSLVRAHFEKSSDKVIASWKSEPADWFGFGSGEVRNPDEAKIGTCTLARTSVRSPM